MWKRGRRGPFQGGQGDGATGPCLPSLCRRRGGSALLRLIPRCPTTQLVERVSALESGLADGASTSMHASQQLSRAIAELAKQRTDKERALSARISALEEGTAHSAAAGAVGRGKGDAATVEASSPTGPPSAQQQQQQASQDEQPHGMVQRLDRLEQGQAAQKQELMQVVQQQQQRLQEQEQQLQKLQLQVQYLQQGQQEQSIEEEEVLVERVRAERRQLEEEQSQVIQHAQQQQQQQQEQQQQQQQRHQRRQEVEGDQESRWREELHSTIASALTPLQDRVEAIVARMGDSEGPPGQQGSQADSVIDQLSRRLNEAQSAIQALERYSDTRSKRGSAVEVGAANRPCNNCLKG